MYKDPALLSRLFRVRPLLEKEGKFYFLSPVPLSEEGRDSTARLKAFLRRWPRCFLFIRSLASAFDEGMDAKEAVAAAFPGSERIGKAIANLGSGVEDLGAGIINVDQYPYPPVEVIADAAALPFRDGSLDMAIAVSLFEHCPEPHRVIAEIARVVKPGGYLYCSVPFLYPFHASPDDFGRFTLTGLRYALRDFEAIRTGTQAGPVTALIVQLAYIMALLSSFGSSRIYGILTGVWLVVLSPLRVMDILLRPFARRDDAAAAVYFFGKRS